MLNLKIKISFCKISPKSFYLVVICNLLTFTRREYKDKIYVRITEKTNRKVGSGSGTKKKSIRIHRHGIGRDATFGEHSPETRHKEKEGTDKYFSLQRDEKEAVRNIIM
jgi:hypothetical protein